MSDAVVAALIGAITSIVVNLITASNQRKKRAVEEAQKETELKMRLDSIEHKLDVHNGYAEKLGDIQTDIAVIKTEIEFIKGVKV